MGGFYKAILLACYWSQEENRDFKSKSRQNWCHWFPVATSTSAAAAGTTSTTNTTQHEVQKEKNTVALTSTTSTSTRITNIIVILILLVVHSLSVAIESATIGVFKIIFLQYQYSAIEKAQVLEEEDQQNRHSPEGRVRRIPRIGISRYTDFSFLFLFALLSS